MQGDPELGPSSLARLVATVERASVVASQIGQFGAGIMAGFATGLHLSAENVPIQQVILFSVLTGIMTFAALFAFTLSVVKLFPRLRGGIQAAAGAAVVGGIATFAMISGTSNATVLGQPEAMALTIQSYLTGGEAGFQDAQRDVAQVSQLVPIIKAGRDVASAMKVYEEVSGETGAGQGPIYAELVAQETRLAALESDLNALVAKIEPQVRAGQAVLERLRESLNDPEMDAQHRQRALENGLMRLSTISIAMREQIPFTSLRAIADMLTSPISLPAYSADPVLRRIQEDTVARLQSEFAPIGAALHGAVTDMEEETVIPVPVFERMSPTEMVFRNAEKLWFVIGVGYALDILPFLSVGIILLAHRQIGQSLPTDMPAPNSAAPRTYRRRQLNGHASPDHPTSGLEQ